MNRNSLQVSVANLKKWAESTPEPMLKFSLPFQRHTGVWNVTAKSNLVWSALSGYYVPPLVFLKEKSGEDGKGKDIFSYQVLDGAQRLSTMFSFIAGDFRLSAGTPEVEVEGTVYDIENCLFSELSEECQAAIKNHRFSITVLDCNMDEAERHFALINSGTSLSNVQKAKPRLGSDLISSFNALLKGRFFAEGINITDRALKAEEDLQILLQTVMLLENRSNGRAYKNISAAATLEFASEIRETYSKEKLEMLTELISYLDKTFVSKFKFLTKNNTPIVAVCAQIAKEQGVEPLSFKAFINEFSNAVYPEYDAASGSGNIKAPKVQMRLRVMFLAMCQYYGWDAEKVGLPFSKDIPLYVNEQSGADATQTSNSDTVNAGVEVGSGDNKESSAENSKVTADTPRPDNASADGAESVEQETVAV